jgi:hypothetical protein
MPPISVASPKGAEAIYASAPIAFLSRAPTRRSICKRQKFEGVRLFLEIECYYNSNNREV